MDRLASTLKWLPARGWLILGMIAVAPMYLRGEPAELADVAVQLGVVLIAFRGFKRLADGLVNMASDACALDQLRLLFDAAKRVDDSAAMRWADSAAEVAHHPPRPVLEAQQVVFRYRGSGRAILDGCDLGINPGDKLLLLGGIRKWKVHSGGAALGAALPGIRTPATR